MVTISESDMRFGEYREEDVFYIEKCEQYKNNLMPNGVKSCEFVLKRADTLYFVEAKTSCPNQITADSTEEKRKKYNEYIAEITDKMRHSLSLYANILLKRHDAIGVPEALLETDLSEKSIKLVLVVKNAKTDWLIPLTDKLNKELKRESKIWKFADFYVINEERARQKHFVI